jgi:hypothetical protein
LLVNVAVLAAVVWPTVSVPKASVAGLIVNGRFPVPLSAIVWGESGALSLTATEPLSAPEIEGLNVTPTMQVALAASEDPQVLLAIAKLPLAVIELTVTAERLLFFSLMVFAALAVPTTCGLKASLNGVGATIGLLATVNGSAAKAAHEYPLG